MPKALAQEKPDLQSEESRKRLFEHYKSIWLASHPEASAREIEAAMHNIAAQVGV